MGARCGCQERRGKKHLERAEEGDEGNEHQRVGVDEFDDIQLRDIIVRCDTRKAEIDAQSVQIRSDARNIQSRN